MTMHQWQPQAYEYLLKKDWFLDTLSITESVYSNHFLILECSCQLLKFLLDNEKNNKISRQNHKNCDEFCFTMPYL